MAHIAVDEITIEMTERMVLNHEGKYTAEELFEMFRNDDTRPLFDMLRDVVYSFLSGYKGKFEYLIDMKTKYLMQGQLSMKQAAGVVNCFRAEASYSGKYTVVNGVGAVVKESSAPAPAPGIIAQSPVMDGIYTLAKGADGANHTTVRLVPHWLEDKAAQGIQVAKYLSGSDNESAYTGFATVDGTRIMVWNRMSGMATTTNAVNVLTALMTSTKEDRAAMGYAYAAESGKCYRCNRTLTVPASQTRGLGPICYEKALAEGSI